MPLTRIKPHRRVIIGRNITLIAATVYALGRAVLYLAEDQSSVTGVGAFLTANGRMLWVWSLAWLVAAVLCAVDMINHRTRYGLSLVVGLAASWGTAHLINWGAAGFVGDGWLDAIGWLTPAALVFGFLIKVTALHDMLTPGGGREEQVADG